MSQLDLPVVRLGPIILGRNLSRQPTAFACNNLAASAVIIMQRGQGNILMITDELRERVRKRATTATSENEMGGIIFQSMADDNVDWRSIGNDGVKQLLVDALFAFHQSQKSHALRVAM